MQKRNTPTGPAKARTTGRATASGHAASAGQVIDLATRGTAIRAWLDAGFHLAIAEAMAGDPGASLRLLSEVGRAR